MLASSWFDRLLLLEAKRVLSNEKLVTRWTRDYLLSLRRETYAELFSIEVDTYGLVIETCRNLVQPGCRDNGYRLVC
jgi:hypothetical protein